MPLVVVLFPSLALLAAFVKAACPASYTINTLKLTLSSSLDDQALAMARDQFQGSLLPNA